MEDLKIHGTILMSLREKVPHKATLTRKLVEKLAIEREAVYRRLRGEVPFSLREAYILSREFGFSIDGLLRGDPAGMNHFKLYIGENDDPLESDIAKLGTVVDMLTQIRNEPYSELCSSSNSLPQGIFFRYEAIARFYMFKWVYQYESEKPMKKFGDIIISPAILDLQKKYHTEAMHIKNTSYIWDNMMIQYLVNDINYFAGINLLDRDEVNLIKGELIALLNEVEMFAAKGAFETGNKVNFYISNINFDASYSYIETSKVYASSIKAFTLNRVTTVDPETFKRLKKWIQSLKRFSTMISESGEIQRVQFFDRQRQLVNSL